MSEVGRPTRIALFGMFGVGNIGNEASLASAVAAIRARVPGAEIVVVCSRPDVVADQHQVDTVPISMSDPIPNPWRLPRFARLAIRPVVEVARWVAAWRFARRCRAVVVPGTGILDDFGEGPLGMPFDLFRWSWAARLARTPMHLMSVGAGPVDHPFSRRLVRQTVRNAAAVTYRDDGSRRFMEGLGVPADPDSVVPDIALALPVPSVVDEVRGSIGVGVMAYYGWDNDREQGGGVFREYLDRISEITCRLLDLGHDVRLLTGQRADEEAVAALRERIELAGRDTRRISADPIADFGDLLEQAGRTEAVVATRFHNVVAAMMTRRPVVSIGYAAKNADLLASAGLERFAFDVEDFDVDEVVAAAVTAHADRAAIADTLDAWLGQRRSELERRFDAAFGRDGARPEPRETA